MRRLGVGLLVLGGLVAVLCEGAWGADLISFGDQWRFFRGKTAPSEPGDAWRAVDFDDSAWETGPSGFGYGDGDDATVLTDMEDNYLTVYIRKTFTADPVPGNATVQLVVDYDDGFVAYINGDEVARRGVADDPATYLSTASSHEAGTPVVIELGLAADVFGPGLNVLAVEGHNQSTGSTDFSLKPALRWTAGPVVVELTADTTWSGAYLNEGTVIVRPGATLRIEPGTVVSMDQGARIRVEGRLLAEGTAGAPIRFTRSAAGTTWKQILFVGAADSMLRHCTIEYADSAGDHKVYYPDYGQAQCDPNRIPPSRNYTEAVVAVACHVDMEGCVFQNLPSAGGEGDAIAIISDDPDHPGDATAHIWDCEFISIGQGIHTRYSYVLVEGCYFTDHHGDNDDIDLYGESTPPPLIRNNLLLNPNHDDMINPTRCSAVIIGNIIGGCDDHGVVLRDKCYPVLINNVIFNCSSAGIAVQNQCDALLVNNTIVNCGRGVRFFDHTGRWGPEYCLYPGSGRATMVNGIVWNCTTSFELQDSPYTGDRGSHLAVRYSDIIGGQGRMSVSANSTVDWGPGNIDADPLFADAAGRDYHLKSQAGRWLADEGRWTTDAVTSPCIDAGDPNSDWTAELWPHGKRINMGAFGGTGQASMSLSQAGRATDLDGDDVTGWPDIARLVMRWLSDKTPQTADVNRDGVVDLKDLSLMGLEWGQ